MLHDDDAIANQPPRPSIEASIPYPSFAGVVVAVADGGDVGRNADDDPIAADDVGFAASNAVVVVVVATAVFCWRKMTMKMKKT